MSRIHSKNTKPEKRLRSLLHQAGYRFRLHVKALPGSPDIVLPKFRTVIFVHGCFWHRHRDCKYSYTPKSRTDFWCKKFNDNIIRDEKNKKLLENLGWIYITIWECEINANAENVLSEIKYILDKRTK